MPAVVRIVHFKQAVDHARRVEQRGYSRMVETKVCASCGRRIEWRKKWESNWDEIRYCSGKCRSRRLRPVDTALEAAILTLLDSRARGATICPSEAARSVAHEDDPESEEKWRALMEPARSAARRLTAAGVVEITQRGRLVDPSTAKGPIRIRSCR